MSSATDRIPTRITALLQIRYPIIQGGMIWCSGWKLASAVSNAGGLGLIGAGSMTPELLKEHIGKTQSATSAPFGVNIPVSNDHADGHVQTCIRGGVKIVFTSAGSPKKYTEKLKAAGVTVLHVVPSAKLAQKVELAGCDAVVAEGTEAGGHNGFEEITSLCLWPHVALAVSIPVIGAGGVASGSGLAAALALGLDGVQVGTRFALSHESSAHPAYKEAAIRAREGEIRLYLRRLMPTRAIVNDYVTRATEAEQAGASPEELREIRGWGRAKQGIFHGDLSQGELEIGQVAGTIEQIFSVDEIVQSFVKEYREAAGRLPGV